MELFYKMLKIPEGRTGVLIGTGGLVKNEIECKCNVVIEIDSQASEVKVMPISIRGFDEKSLKAIEIIQAILHGFTPSTAFRLMEEDISLLVIDLLSHSTKSSGSIGRKKGRIIGANGKARKTIEDLSGASISVHNNTVSFVGGYEEITVARNAVMMLLQGRPHRTVYQMLQNARRKAKLDKMKLWEDINSKFTE